MLASPTELVQIAMGRPRRAAGNQTAMAEGAATMMRPMPAPSMKRPVNRSAADPESAPIAAPTATVPTETRPVALIPIFCRMKPAGIASTNPMMEKIDMSMPALE